MSKRFSYVKYDDSSVARQQLLKAYFEQVEIKIDMLEDGRAKDHVLDHLEIAYMWVGKAIRDEQIIRTGKVDEQPERNNG